MRPGCEKRFAWRYEQIWGVWTSGGKNIMNENTNRYKKSIYRDDLISVAY